MRAQARVATLPMTTVIAALVISSIILSVGAVSAVTFMTQRQQAMEAGHAQQQTNLGAAASILERRIPNGTVQWSDTGEMTGFRTFAMPTPADKTVATNELSTAVTRVTGQPANVLKYDPQTDTFTAITSSLTGAEGATVAPVDVVIAGSSPVGSALKSGQRYVGEVELLGTTYYGSAMPITNAKSEVLGAIQVMTPVAQMQQSANAALVPIAMSGGTAIVLLGLMGLIASRRISRPIPQLAGIMRSIAGGAYDAAVPHTKDRNEIGEMARAVEVLRESAVRVSQMTEADAARVIADEQKRVAMMAELQSSFGQVVEAALEGDFSKRVDSEFADKELNVLASGINELVDGLGRCVEELAGVLAGMANADLTQRMRGNYRGAFATLKQDTNALAEKFASIMGELKTAAALLRTATGEILSGADELSGRTAREAATIEETSASVEQLASTVARNATRAGEASQNAVTVTKAATKSGDTMRAADEAMERIQASSAKISNIIGLIDDIAFQTNLLALNASVEAARAGEAGKGFAVVAVEVRRLAQSAAEASSEVKVLIEQAANEVTAGSRLVGEAGKGLETMRGAAQANETLLDAIAQDSREQAASIEEISAAMRQLDEMTQHNASLVEETNAAIENTNGQAAALDRIVSVFSLDEPVVEIDRARRQPTRPRHGGKADARPRAEVA